MRNLFLVVFLLGFGTVYAGIDSNEKRTKPILMEICGPLLGGEPISVSPQNFILLLKQHIMALRDYSGVDRDLSIQRLGWYQLNPVVDAATDAIYESLSLEILRLYSELLHALDKIVLNEPTHRKSVLAAIEKFVIQNKGRDSFVFVIGRSTLDMVGQWTKDYRLPLEYRKQVAVAVNSINGEIFIDPETIKTSEQLRSAETIPFLGRAKKELSDVALKNAYRVENLIPQGSHFEKLQLFETLSSGEPIPLKVLLTAVDQLTLKNENGFGQFLIAAGFKYERLRNQTVQNSYRYGVNGAQIIFSGETKWGAELRNYTEIEIFKFKELLKRAIQTPGASVIINVASGA